MKQNQVALIIGVVGMVALGGIYFWANRPLDNSQNQTTQNTTNSQQAEIDALKKTVEDLKNQKSQTPKSLSITDIVNEWQPVIPIVVCNFRNSSGVALESYEGSAILMRGSIEGIFSVVTNKHIITNDVGNFANDCEIQFPNDPQIFTTLTSDMNVNPSGADAATIMIRNPSENIKELINTSKKKFCLSKPNVGDGIVILGYPAIGASSGITATEGIISGYDGDYYVTSAKVEHGNSGGAAIDIKNNCDLGIPTLVETGSLESLARILKWQVVAPADQIKNATNNKL